jgi:hypothetical protein
MSMTATSALAGKGVKLRTNLTQDCTNCRTDLTPVESEITACWSISGRMMPAMG